MGILLNVIFNRAAYTTSIQHLISVFIFYFTWVAVFRVTISLGGNRPGGNLPSTEIRDRRLKMFVQIRLKIRPSFVLLNSMKFAKFVLKIRLENALPIRLTMLQIASFYWKMMWSTEEQNNESPERPDTKRIYSKKIKNETS